MNKSYTIDGLPKTRVTFDDATNMARVIYHNIEIAVFDKTSIRLSTGGILSPTTKTRMNQISHLFQLGFKIKTYSLDDDWTAHTDYLNPLKPYILPVGK